AAATKAKLGEAIACKRREKDRHDHVNSGHERAIEEEPGERNDLKSTLVIQQALKFIRIPVYRRRLHFSLGFETAADHEVDRKSERYGDQQGDQKPEKARKPLT